MAEDKKSFVLYVDYIHTVKKLPKDKQAELFMLILSYVNDENPTTEDLLLEIAFEPIKQQLKRDLKKYERKKIQYAEAGKASAEKRKNSTNVNERQRTSTNVESENSCSTNSTVNDNDNVNDTVTVNVNELSKDNINNDAFADECLSANQWCETVCMQNKIRPDRLEEMLSEFTVHLISVEEQKKTLKEFKEHFANWLRKKPSTVQSSSTAATTNQRQPTYHDD